MVTVLKLNARVLVRQLKVVGRLRIVTSVSRGSIPGFDFSNRKEKNEPQVYIRHSTYVQRPFEKYGKSRLATTLANFSGSSEQLY